MSTANTIAIALPIAGLFALAIVLALKTGHKKDDDAENR